MEKLLNTAIQDLVPLSQVNLAVLSMVDTTDVICVVNGISSVYTPVAVQQSAPRFLEQINALLHQHFNQHRPTVAQQQARNRAIRTPSLSRSFIPVSARPPSKPGQYPPSSGLRTER